MKTARKFREKFSTAFVAPALFSLGAGQEKEASNASLSLLHLSLWLKAKESRLLTLTLTLVHTLFAKRKRRTSESHICIPQSRIPGKWESHWFSFVYSPAQGMAILPLHVWLYRSRQFPHLQATSKHLRISCDGAGRKALVQEPIEPVLRRRPPWDTGRFADKREVNIVEPAMDEIQRQPIRETTVFTSLTATQDQTEGGCYGTQTWTPQRTP